MRRIVAGLSVLAAIALLGLSSAAFAAERVVHVKVRADSEHPGTQAFRAMDGNPGSIWHSLWKPPAAVTGLPHEIVVDLGGVYEISGFTYVPRPGTRNGRIKDYEAYLGGPSTTSVPLARNIGKPVAKGAFPKPDAENVVKFPAPVKGRYFRLRALSNVTAGQNTWAGIGDLKLHCKGVKFVGKPWSLKVDFPKAGNDVITLIEGFPLLARLLELGDPWRWDAMVLKDQLFPKGIEPFGGEEKRGVFVDRRMTYNWQKIGYDEAAERKLTDNPGQQIWERHAYETNYYALASARPLIRMHLGRPLLNHVDKMKVLFPKLKQTARRDIPARMDRIVEALKPYGAKKLPRNYKSQPYLLPGGTRMTITDYTVDGWAGRYGDSDYDDVRIKIDFEPAAVPGNRRLMPQFVPWRAAEAGRKGERAKGMTLGHLQPLAAATAGKDVAGGKGSARQWSDKSEGFASVDALGQNGTTGGAGGKVVTVTTEADLKKYAQAKEPYIIRVKGEIRVTEKKNPKTRYDFLTTKEIHIASDKTIIGVGKSGHIVGGGFFIGPGTHNVILRNLTIRDSFLAGDWAGVRNDFDGLQMDNAHHIWVDHCHFRRHGDGCLDNREGTTYLTVSWSIFSDHNKTFGCGWDSKVTAHITLHHTWFRNTACRAPGAGQVLRAHYYNNYLQNIGVHSHLVLIGTNMVIQNSLFERVANPILRVDGTCTIANSGSVFRHCGGRHDIGGRIFFDASRFYPYTLDEAEALPGLLKKYAGPQENIGK